MGFMIRGGETAFGTASPKREAEFLSVLGLADS